VPTVLFNILRKHNNINRSLCVIAMSSEIQTEYNRFSVLYYGRKSVQEVSRFAFRSYTKMQCHLQLPMQSVPTTKSLSSNPAHGQVYSIQHYVLKLVSDL
jgi:hypothetical protein